MFCRRQSFYFIAISVHPLPEAAASGLDGAGVAVSHDHDVRASSVYRTNLDLGELQQMLQNGNSLVSSFLSPYWEADPLSVKDRKEFSL